MEISSVLDVHHIHVWSIDGYNNYATMHVVTDSEMVTATKEAIREELREHGIFHVTIEVEKMDEKCEEMCCMVNAKVSTTHHHHH